MNPQLRCEEIRKYEWDRNRKKTGKLSEEMKKLKKGKGKEKVGLLHPFQAQLGPYLDSRDKPIGFPPL